MTLFKSGKKSNLTFPEQHFAVNKVKKTSKSWTHVKILYLGGKKSLFFYKNLNIPIYNNVFLLMQTDPGSIPG